MRQATTNLLIVHTPGCQDLSDWLEVKSKIAICAPDIDVRIGNNTRMSPIARKWQTTRPSLLFSPLELSRFKPRGGTIYAGRRYTKLDQVRRLEAAGLPVPRSLALIPGLLLKSEVWGEYVIVKPYLGSFGIGVRIVRADELPWRFPALVSGIGDGGRMLVQQFIDHTDESNRPVDYRALMMFGRPLYLHRRRWDAPRRPLSELARDLSGDIASNARWQYRHRDLVKEPEVLELAAKVASAFDEIPVLGIDIVRERSTGALYVLEVNPRGGTWHFSSTIGKRHFTEEVRLASYHQFNAIDTAAGLLIEKTRAEAS